TPAPWTLGIPRCGRPGRRPGAGTAVRKHGLPAGGWGANPPRAAPGAASYFNGRIGGEGNQRISKAPATRPRPAGPSVSRGLSGAVARAVRVAPGGAVALLESSRKAA